MKGFCGMTHNRARPAADQLDIVRWIMPPCLVASIRLGGEGVGVILFCKYGTIGQYVYVWRRTRLYCYCDRFRGLLRMSSVSQKPDPIPHHLTALC